jgi:hypothetical protein
VVHFSSENTENWEGGDGWKLNLGSLAMLSFSFFFFFFGGTGV